MATSTSVPACACHSSQQRVDPISPSLDSGVSLGLALTNNMAEVALSGFQSLALRCLGLHRGLRGGQSPCTRALIPGCRSPMETGAQQPPAQPGPCARLCEATVGSQVQLNPSCNPTGHHLERRSYPRTQPKESPDTGHHWDYVWRCFFHSRSVKHTPTVTL